jgi:modulator of FtsH protease
MTDPRAISQSAGLDLSINKTLRSAFILLAIVLACAAGGTFVGLGIELPRFKMMWLVFMVVFMGGPFLIRSIRNLQTAILVTCAWAALVGLMMSPMIGRFLSFAGGPTILFNALATTAVAFVALSGYAIVSRRDFSFMGGFLFVGFIVALVAIIANIFLQIPVLSLAISSVVVLLCAGSMLYNVSRLVHDGNADPLMIVVELFADIAVMFSHLLNLFGIMGSDD